jgi:hypothetical protein
VGVCHLAGKAYVFVLVSPSSSLTLGRSTRDIVGVASAGLCPKGGTDAVQTSKTNGLAASVKSGTLSVQLTIAANKNVRSYELVARRGNSQVRIVGTMAKLQKVLTKSFKIGGSGKVTIQLKTWIGGSNVTIKQVKV